MEQLSRARPCGCQDTGQIARMGFRSSWRSQCEGKQMSGQNKTGHGPVPWESVLERFSTWRVLSKAHMRPSPDCHREQRCSSFGKTQAGTTGGLYEGAVLEALLCHARVCARVCERVLGIKVATRTF